MVGSMGATMARPKGKKSERNDVAVKVDRAIISKARLVAAHRDVSVAELLSDLLKVPMDKAYAQMLRELEATP